jgi:hypothetical protein
MRLVAKYLFQVAPIYTESKNNNNNIKNACNNTYVGGRVIAAGSSEQLCPPLQVHSPPVQPVVLVVMTLRLMPRSHDYVSDPMLKKKQILFSVLCFFR